MKKVVSFLIVLLFAALGYGQALFDETLSATGTTYSLTYYTNLNPARMGKWNGSIGLSLNVDSLDDGHAASDTAYYFPQYWIGGEWVLGDTIEWKIPDNDGTTNGWSDSTVVVVPEANHSDILIWRNEPSGTLENIQQFKCDKFRVKRVVSGDYVSSKCVLRIHPY